MKNGSKWATLTVEEATERLIDYRGKTPPKSESGIPLISAANVQAGRVVLDSPDRLPMRPT